MIGFRLPEAREGDLNILTDPPPSHTRRDTYKQYGSHFAFKLDHFFVPDTSPALICRNQTGRLIFATIPVALCRITHRPCPARQQQTRFLFRKEGGARIGDVIPGDKCTMAPLQEGQ